MFHLAPYTLTIVQSSLMIPLMLLYKPRENLMQYVEEMTEARERSVGPTGDICPEKEIDLPVAELPRVHSQESRIAGPHDMCCATRKR